MIMRKVQQPLHPTLFASHLQWRPVKAISMAGIIFVDILVRVRLVRDELFLKSTSVTFNVSRENICRL
jgi:hypothetical protein